jgi:hypothetical protein
MREGAVSKSDKKGEGGDYAIGRGKPPHQSRWQKGVSGNPGGKKKGTSNLKTALQDALLRPVTITENGEKKVISMREALIMRLVEAGLKGDSRAINAIFDRDERLIGIDREKEIETAEEDPEILKRVGRRKVNGNANPRPTSDAAEAEDEIDTTPDKDEDDHA